MQEARGLFDELDVDGSGAVDGAELEGLVNLALQRASDEGGGHICLYQHQGYLYVPES